MAEFRDAHTSGELTNSSLPHRAQVAYLGFNGKRKGDALWVTELLPTIAPISGFPIKPGDLITHVDGKSLVEAVRGEIIPSRNLGNDESSLTAGMNKYFNRLSTAFSLPSATSIKITYLPKGQTPALEVELPWIVRDLYDFKRDQEAAAPVIPPKKAILERDLFRMGESFPFPMVIGFKNFDGTFFSSQKFERLMNRVSEGYHWIHSFIFVDQIAEWTADFERDENGKIIFDDATDTPETRLRKVRMVPEGAVFVPGAVTFPAYVTRERVMDRNEEPTGATALVAYIYVDTFSPGAAERDVIAEFSKTLRTLRDLNVQNIVIDLINNGGGSLSLGLMMAQLLSPTKIVPPEIRFGLNDHWLDEFENGSLNGPSDAERELYRRVFEKLKEDFSLPRQHPIGLSRKFSAEELYPFVLRPNPDLERPFRIVLIVNEMCASMCDIFTAVLQDNEMATIVGAQTMGAGGNVVEHYHAPSSHFILRQTESLILRKDGTYIENNGVVPDIAVKVNEDVQSKYTAVRAKAYRVFTQGLSGPLGF